MEKVYVKLLVPRDVYSFTLPDGSVVEVRRVLVGYAIGEQVFSTAAQAASEVWRRAVGD
jgi:hypothetical protein